MSEKDDIVNELSSDINETHIEKDKDGPFKIDVDRLSSVALERAEKFFQNRMSSNIYEASNQAPKPNKFLVSKEGWMKKLEKVEKKQKPRWFVLGEGSLIYFVSQNKWDKMSKFTLHAPSSENDFHTDVKKLAKGAIPLADAKITKCAIKNADEKKSFSIKTSKRNYDFICDTEEECEEWKERLRHEIGTAIRPHLTINFQLANDLEEAQKKMQVQDEEEEEAKKHEDAIKFVNDMSEDLKKHHLEYAAKEIEEHYRSYMHSRNKWRSTLTAQHDEDEPENALHPSLVQTIRKEFAQTMKLPPNKPFQVDYVHEVELQPKNIKRERDTPYDTRLVITEQAWFSAWGGQAADYNDQILAGPSRRAFYEVDPKATISGLTKLVFLGDFNMLNREAAPAVHPTLKGKLHDADAVFVNLEAIVSNLRRDKRFHLHTSTKLFNMSREFVKDCSTRMEITPSKIFFTLANNHAGDAGKAPGISHALMNIAVLGGTWLGAQHDGTDKIGLICIADFKGTRLGIVAWTSWMNRDSRKNRVPVFAEEDIIAIGDFKPLKQRYKIDILIGYPHWEYENANHPSISTSKLARKLWLSGFDLLVGHGTHTLLPVEVFEPGPGIPSGPQHRCVCAYSLGNWCGQRGRPVHKLGGFFEVQILEKQIVSFKMTPICHKPGHPSNRIVVAPFAAVPHSEPLYRPWWIRVQSVFYDDHEYLTNLQKDGSTTYQIRVYTSKLPKAATHEARVLITVRGDKAASPEWDLDATTAALPSDQDAFQRGSRDVFFFSSPWDLGDLKTMKIVLQCRGQWVDWHLDKIVVLNMSSLKDWEFKVDTWFTQKQSYAIIPAKSKVDEGRESVEVFALKKFEEIEPYIQTGDVMACNCFDALGSFIKFFTRSSWTHVTTLVVNETIENGKPGHILSYEATQNDCRIPDVSSGELYYPGVHCFDIRQVLSNYTGDIYYLPRRDRTPLSPAKKSALIQYCEKLHQQKQMFAYMQMYGAGMRGILGLESVHHAMTYQSDSQVFCAEMVVRSLQEGGLISYKVNPCALVPDDIIGLSIFDSKKMVKLKTWNPRHQLGIPRNMEKMVLKSEKEKKKAEGKK